MTGTAATETTEKEVPLAAGDYEKLRVAKAGGIGCFLIFLVPLLLISAVVYLVITDEGATLRFGPLEVGLGIVVVPFTPALIAIAFFILRRYRGKASMDVNHGKKRVVTSQVIRRFTEELDPGRRTKFANTTAYLIEVAGRQYDLKDEDYPKFEKGMPVEIHSAIHSGEFLGIYDPRTGSLLCDDLLEPAT